MILKMILKPTPKKYYKKAARFHKKGEAFYQSKKFELAEACYEKAGDYRQKAQELEKK